MVINMKSFIGFLICFFIIVNLHAEDADEAAKVDAELKSAGLETARDAAREFDRACAALEARLRDNGSQSQALRAQRDDIDDELSAERGEQQSAQARQSECCSQQFR